MNILGINLSDLIISASAIIICLTFHEVSHGYVAYLLGDTTAKDEGRLTLNPIYHIDIVGFLCLILFHFGWAKPVSCRPDRFKRPILGMAIVALAGPLSNFLTAFVFTLIAGGIDIALYYNANAFFAALSDFLWIVVQYSIALGVFNLIPLPPLDGSKIIMPILPKKAIYFINRYENYGMIILLILLYKNLISLPLSIMTNTVFNGIFFVGSKILSWVVMLIL